MKIFAKTKNLWKKIILVFTIFTTISIVTPEPVQATSLPGGELMTPIASFLVGLGDGIMDAIHSSLIHQGRTIIRIDIKKSWTDNIKVIIGWVLCFIIVSALVFSVAGGALAFVAPIAKLFAAGVTVTKAITGLAYFVSVAAGISASVWFFNSGEWGNDEVNLPLYAITPEEIFKNDENLPLFSVNFFNPDENQVIHYKTSTVESSTNLSSSGAAGAPTEALKKMDEANARQTEGTIHTLSYDLHKFIFAGYRALRMIAIVGMMSVLVYTGIRIVISAGAPQKAKYKQLLGDWFIGLVLLFSMHYIMYFSNLFVDQLSHFLNGINRGVYIAELVDEDEKISKALKEAGFKINDKQTLNADTTLEQTSLESMQVMKYKGDDDQYHIEWYTNLMGILRMRLNYNAEGDDVAYIGYTIMFLVMVIYTIVFGWTYIKRVLYMAFLTIIAPLVALTYPIDKMNDGNAQGFNYWFKEYIFNLLLQPLHLLIYTLLVSAAIELSLQNVIYGLVALGFIAGAEKIVRRMFNFQKAETPGILAGPAGAAMTFQGMRWLLNHGPHGPNGSGRDRGPNGGTNNRAIPSGGKGESNEELWGDVSSRIGDGNDTNNIENNVEGSEYDPSYNDPNYNDPNYISYLHGLGDGMNSDNYLDSQNANDNNLDNGLEFDSRLYDLDDPGFNNSKYMEYINGSDIDESDFDLSYNDPNYDDPNYIEYLHGLDNGMDPNNNMYELTDNTQSQNFENSINEGEEPGGSLPSNGGTRPTIQQHYSGTEPKEERPEQIEKTAKPTRREKVKENIKGMGRGIKRSIEDAHYNNLNNVEDKIKNVRKTATDVVSKTALGTAAVIAGAATGVASGSAGNTVKNAALLGAAGVKVGGGVANSANTKVDKINESYQRGKLGDAKYEEEQRNKAIKKLAKDRETLRTLSQGLGISMKKAEQIANERAKTYVDNGFSNPTDWVVMEKMQDKYIDFKDNRGNRVHRKYDTKEAIAAMKMHRRYPQNPGKEKDVKNQIAKDNSGFSPAMVEISYNAMRAIEEIKNG